jgi:hypothetical protein
LVISGCTKKSSLIHSMLCSFLRTWIISAFLLSHPGCLRLLRFVLKVWPTIHPLPLVPVNGYNVRGEFLWWLDGTAA